MIASGKELPPMDGDDTESAVMFIFDERLSCSDVYIKGKCPLLHEPPPASFTSAQNAGARLKTIYESSAGILWSSSWKDHVHRLDELNSDRAALVDWLLLPSETSKTSERQFSFLKLLTLHGLTQNYEAFNFGADSGPSETPDIPTGEYFLQREQNRKSFYNILEIDNIEGFLPSAARSLPAGVISYMLLQDVCMAPEVARFDEELLRKFMLFSGFTDEHGYMNMNVFCEWVWDFQIRETSNAYVAAELRGDFDGGPAGEFFRHLAIGHDFGYTVDVIGSAFSALGLIIETFEAIVLLQDPWKFYRQIQVNSTRRYIRYRPHPTAPECVFDKWECLHRLMIFVACYMTLRVESSTGMESSTTPESPTTPAQPPATPAQLAATPESPATSEGEPSPEVSEEIQL